MKKLMLTAVAAGVVGFGVQSAQAGDREWATVGKVLTGVAAGVVIANAMDCQPAYASVSYGYSAPCYSVSYTVSAPPPCPPPPPVYVSAPVVVQQPVIYAPAPVIVRQPVMCAPPVRYVTYSAPGRGHAYGHYKHRSPGRW